jgi:hypothetical protein
MRWDALVRSSLAAGMLWATALAWGWGGDVPTNPDDGWRRTAAGWERKELWAHPIDHAGPKRMIHPAKPSQPVRRWDIHPAALAAGQIALVTLAFLIWRESPRKPLTGLAGSRGEAA